MLLGRIELLNALDTNEGSVGDKVKFTALDREFLATKGEKLRGPDDRLNGQTFEKIAYVV